MIARIWRGIASLENAPHYIAHFQQDVLPELKQLEGFEDVYVLQRHIDDGVELTVMTMWQSLDAIGSFAGQDTETAVVAPAAQAVLLSFDKHVMHHEIVVKGSEQ